MKIRNVNPNFHGKRAEGAKLPLRLPGRLSIQSGRILSLPEELHKE